MVAYLCFRINLKNTRYIQTLNSLLFSFNFRLEGGKQPIITMNFQSTQASIQGKTI